MPKKKKAVHKRFTFCPVCIHDISAEEGCSFDYFECYVYPQSFLKQSHVSRMKVFALLLSFSLLTFMVNCVSRKPDEGPSNRYSSRLSSLPPSPGPSASPSRDPSQNRSSVRTPPRSRSPSPKYSDYSATDSNDSFTGKSVAPGTEEYHKGMHRLYNRKTSYHNEIFKGSIKRERNFALEHREEMESSDRRHRIHGKIKKKIASGRLKPGIRKKLPEPFPKEPNTVRVNNLRKNRRIDWRQKKGFKRLLPIELPEGQERKRRQGEPRGPYSPPSSLSTSTSSSSSSELSSPPPAFSPNSSDGGSKGGVAEAA